ncbi:MAG: PocR ligand-binding domain-containing protein [Spirochaetaceae bacterium]
MNTVILENIKSNFLPMLKSNFENISKISCEIIDIKENDNINRKSCNGFIMNEYKSSICCTKHVIYKPEKKQKKCNCSLGSCCNDIIKFSFPIVIDKQYFGNLISEAFLIKPQDGDLLRKKKGKRCNKLKKFLIQMNNTIVIDNKQITVIMKSHILLLDLISKMTLLEQELIILNDKKESKQKKILSMCSYCKRIRNKNNEWEDIESYMLNNYQGAEISHSLCSECVKREYPDIYKRLVKRNIF